MKEQISQCDKESNICGTDQGESDNAIYYREEVIHDVSDQKIEKTILYSL